MKQITYIREAIQALSKMPANTSRLIRSKLNQYAEDPASLGNNVIVMAGTMKVFRRMRVGDWRIIFKETGEVIAVEKIASRGGVYD
ncbi:type II toxin-antitoxin system RelE family toxin [Ochrobactrum sp. BTU1]|uniref:type II toxin-antitoxin system RelE family toxin n=1 Tax=Ochrobactrum sp. BTU1 TaxID=2840456 RepID=UPI001C03FECF|nr:type II toxin-antitoxin system RelE/ParE family toxin [Ochrobactrum sp. BTU1]